MLFHVEKLKKLPAHAAKIGRLGKKKFESFQREERGSIIIFSLFMFVLMLMISGMAVDLMRAETQRARLQSTLDRAVLAGASLDQALDSEAVVRDYFAKAGLTDYLTGVQVIPGDNMKTVNATAFMAVNTFFMQMMGIDEMHAPAAGTAEESLSNIEISLIVDISGSMGNYSSSSGNRKITDLIAAAQEFVYLMQCNPDDTEVDPMTGAPLCTVDPNTVSISLVPYSEQVLVGEDLLSYFNASSEHTDSSCVDFDTADFSTTEVSLTDTIKRSGNIDPWTNYNNNPSWTKTYPQNRTCQTDTFREIVPLSESYSDLQTILGTLSYGGNTSIDLGLKWGVALLDPKFNPAVQAMTLGGSPTIVPEFDDRPYEFNARSMQKVVVLMTDGVNTTQHVLKDAYKSGLSEIWYHADRKKETIYYAGRSSSNKYCVLDGSGDRCYWQSSPYSYGGVDSVQLTWPEAWNLFRVDMYEDMSWTSDPVTDINSSTKNTRLNSVCSAAKSGMTTDAYGNPVERDIEIFTIGFETSTTSANVMKACASSESHHFDANGLNLANAFTSIAREIHELRLTN